MSTYNPTTQGEIVNGFAPTMKTPGFSGQSHGERIRAGIDYLWERMFLTANDATINPSPAPISTIPINPGAFPLYGAPGNTGILLSQHRRRAERSLDFVVNAGDVPVPSSTHWLQIENPYVADAIPMLHGFVAVFDDGGGPTQRIEPKFTWLPTGLYLSVSAPAIQPGLSFVFSALASLWEIGATGSGFTSGGVVTTPAYDPIPDADIAADGKAYASLFRKIRNRLDFLKGAIDGQSDAQKINAQAIPTQSSASGQGLVAKMWQYRKVTVSGSVGAGATVELNTGIVAANTVGPVLAPILYGITGSNYELQPIFAQVSVAATPTYYLRVANLGLGAATFSADCYFIQT